MNQLSFSFNEKRFQLIESIRNKGINDENVLEAMLQLPRENFVEKAFINRSYDDNALPISCNQTISQPYTVAYMTELLDIQTGMKVLEIGTGSGYQAAILFLMGANVYTIERHEELINKTVNKFSQMDFDINAFHGDGTVGLPEHAPYDRIIVTAAAPDIPNSLIKQLKIGGKLVVPIGDKNVQSMHMIVRVDEQNYDDFEKDDFKFVPLIGDEGWEEQ